MNCIKCGKKLIDGSKFCNSCGTAQPEAVVEPKSKKNQTLLIVIISLLVVVVILLLILLLRRTGTSDTASGNPVNMENEQTVNIVGKQETEKDKGTLEDTEAEDVPTETTTEDPAQSQAATLTVKVKAADFAVVKDSDSAKVLKDAGLADKLSVKNGERLIRGKLQLSRKLMAEEKKQFSFEGKVTDSAKKAVPATVYVGTGGKVYIILSKSLPTGDYTVTVTIRVGEESYNKKVVLHLKKDTDEVDEHIRYVYYSRHYTDLYCYDMVTHESRVIFSRLDNGHETNGFSSLKLSGNTLYAIWELSFGSDPGWVETTDIEIRVDGNESNSSCGSRNQFLGTRIKKNKVYRIGNYEYSVKVEGETLVTCKDVRSGKTEVLCQEDVAFDRWHDDVRAVTVIENTLFFTIMDQEYFLHVYAVDMKTKTVTEILKYFES